MEKRTITIEIDEDQYEYLVTQAQDHNISLDMYIAEMINQDMLDFG